MARIRIHLPQTEIMIEPVKADIDFDIDFDFDRAVNFEHRFCAGPGATQSDEV